MTGAVCTREGRRGAGGGDMRGDFDAKSEGDRREILTKTNE